MKYLANIITLCVLHISFFLSCTDFELIASLCVVTPVKSCGLVDCDNDGLIEIRSIEMLDHVRFNQDGTS